MKDECIVCQNRPLCKKAKSSCKDDKNFVINWHYVGYLNMAFYPWVDKEKVEQFIFETMTKEERIKDYEKYVLGSQK